MSTWILVCMFVGAKQEYKLPMEAAQKVAYYMVSEELRFDNPAMTRLTNRMCTKQFRKKAVDSFFRFEK